jgi:hypothetical protein
MATELGKEWLEGRTRALNKTCDPDSCPDAVKKMWESYLNAHTKEVEVAVSREFEKDYMCRVIDQRSWDITKILTDASVKAWRGEARTHIYF